MASGLISSSVSVILRVRMSCNVGKDHEVNQGVLVVEIKRALTILLAVYCRVHADVCMNRKCIEVEPATLYAALTTID